MFVTPNYSIQSVKKYKFKFLRSSQYNVDLLKDCGRFRYAQFHVVLQLNLFYVYSNCHGDGTCTHFYFKNHW